MALNLGKWNIINPETRKPYMLKETQEFFQKLSDYNYIYPDITSPEYKEYVKKRFILLDLQPANFFIVKFTIISYGKWIQQKRKRANKGIYK